MSGDGKEELQTKYDQAIFEYVTDSKDINPNFKPELMAAFVYFLEIRLQRRPRNKAQENDIFEMNGVSKDVFFGLMKTLEFEENLIMEMWNDSMD